MSLQDYLNFDLNVEALDDNKLQISVAASPFGATSVEAPVPFTDEELTPFLGVLDGSTQVSRTDRVRLYRAFSERLGNAVFAGPVGEAYLASLTKAGSRGLRLRLGLEKAGDLKTLPWELLRSPQSNAQDYLGLSRQVALVRYVPQVASRPAVEISLPVRVLVMVSNPADQPALDADAEWRAIQDATADLRSRGLLEIDRVDDGQLITLQRKLREEVSYQIFHYIGYTLVDGRSGAGVLALEDPRGNVTIPVAGEALTRELVEENSVRLVFLDACRTVRQNGRAPFLDAAARLVASGIPAVVAMQTPASDPARVSLFQEFYKELCEGYPLETALAEARQAMGSASSQEWLAPTLYLHTASGNLFTRRKAYDEPTSMGGLRETLTPRILIPAMVVILALCGIFALLIANPPPPPTPDRTPGTAQVTPTEVADVDLAVTDVLFNPAKPTPGQTVSVTLRIENRGTVDSGAFNWAWYDFDPSSVQNPRPTIQKEVTNLRPGVPLVVKGEFTFDWWGQFTTVGWANFDNRVPDTNPRNNLFKTLVSTNLDFRELPTGEPILDSVDLSGDEFAPWGVSIRTEPGAGDCASAVARLVVKDNASRIVTGLPGGAGGTRCTGVPVSFRLDPPSGKPLFSGVSVAFAPAVPGVYGLDLVDADGIRLQLKTLEVKQADIAPDTFLLLEVNAPSPEVSLRNARAVFRVPQGGSVTIPLVVLRTTAAQR